MKQFSVAALIACALSACTANSTAPAEVQAALTAAGKYCSVATAAGPVVVAIAPASSVAVTDVDLACTLISGVAVPAAPSPASTK